MALLIVNLDKQIGNAQAADNFAAGSHRNPHLARCRRVGADRIPRFHRPDFDPPELPAEGDVQPFAGVEAPSTILGQVPSQANRQVAIR
jgi:hypothetical protein